MEENLNFGDVLAAMKKGKKASKKYGLSGKSAYLYIVPDNDPALTDVAKTESGSLVHYGAYIAHMTEEGKVVPWSANQSLILDEDWIILD